MTPQPPKCESATGRWPDRVQGSAPAALEASRPGRGGNATRQPERVHWHVDLFGMRWPGDVWIVLRILAPVEHPIITDDTNLSTSQLFLPTSCGGCSGLRVCPGLEQNGISRFQD